MPPEVWDCIVWACKEAEQRIWGSILQEGGEEVQDLCLQPGCFVNTQTVPEYLLKAVSLATRLVHLLLLLCQDCRNVAL